MHKDRKTTLAPLAPREVSEDQLKMRKKEKEREKKKEKQSEKKKEKEGGKKKERKESNLFIKKKK